MEHCRGSRPRSQDRNTDQKHHQHHQPRDPGLTPEERSRRSLQTGYAHATMPVMDAAECFVCRKHREREGLVPGGFVGEDELVVVSHAAPWPEAPRGLLPEVADFVRELRGYLDVG
jgi:hypothetical protein